jgi:hypothetical protein
MGKVLTESTTLKCAAPGGATSPVHGGTLVKTGTARLRVEGAAVLTDENVQGATISGCGDTAGGQTPCSKITSVTGTATKLRVQGHPVVLDAIGGQTFGNPVGTIKPTAGIPNRLRSE